MSIKLIQAQVLDTAAASVTFSNIPQYYKTLKILMSVRTTAGNVNEDVFAKFNTVTTNQSDRILVGTGSGAVSGTSATIRFAQATGNTATASTFSSCETTIPNYSGSTYKPMSMENVGETNGTTAYQILNAGLWSSNNAITSMEIYGGSGTLVAGSSFYLYGVF